MTADRLPLPTVAALVVVSAGATLIAAVLVIARLAGLGLPWWALAAPLLSPTVFLAVILLLHGKTPR